MSDIQERIEHNFTYHPPRDDQQRTEYEMLREAFKSLALRIVRFSPESREQSLALTELEEASFWTNAAKARNEH